MKNKKLKSKMVVLSNFVSQHRVLSANKSADRNKFHFCTSFLLFISMFFGLFPLHGIRDDNVKHLVFRWKSPMVFHSIFLICSGLIISMGSIPWLFKDGSIQALSNFTFFFRGFLTGVIFLRLAQKWPNFLQKFESVELILSRYPPSKNVRKQLRILNGIVLFHGLVEHCLVQIRLFVDSVLEQNGDILLGFKRFFVHYSYGYMFNLMPYTLVGGWWIQYTNVNLTFSWTFLDLFICSTAIIIASKIYQISSRVRQLISKEVILENDWRIVREDFGEIFDIFKEYNRLFNPLLLLSFTVNVYFLLVQLFGAMTKPFTPASFMYYILSFGLLVTRLVLVCLGGAQIHEESQELTTLLATVPSFLYNEEIFGALVAYEVILIQFQKELVT